MDLTTLHDTRTHTHTHTYMLTHTCTHTQPHKAGTMELGMYFKNW